MKQCIYISSDDGRPIRPLVVINPDTNTPYVDYPGQKLSIAQLCTGRTDISDKDFFSIERIVDFDGLSRWKSEPTSLSRGIIEYIDPQE